MSELRVASRYAKSLIDLASEKGELENINQDMLLFLNTLKNNSEFKLLLKNQIVKSDKKLAILHAVFEGKVSKMTMMFFDIITRKGRENVLDFIATEFQSQYNLKKGIQKAKIITAVPLTPQLRNDFSQLVASQTGKLVQLEESVDASIIGGFVLKVGDKQIDSSVQNSIRKLRNKFKENPYITKL
ncbi:MAG: ATP synthase F1 subunit delta [Hymenobacteraceae bacterium]|nr:ATP synthase F1 subunit delta [Hymenobacteraceae bacterium]MDX5395492.1 ATP synthase F1 subunit delta [Hymenobacteraceae bacterium]MDX5443444.1 ATP synthase F1 subunit delta [Hymenobacteraceae bacterium]MDX5511544.1 ATP synthase F1 subunit delta [Hymenobacteraceae bacterium]